MALNSRAIGFPSIKNINVSDKNLSIILQNMKERIEKYKLAFEEQQRDIEILAKRLSEQEVAKEQIELRGDFEEADMTDIEGEDLLEGASPPTDDVRYVAEDFIPAGITATYAGTTAPRGWLECNGAAVSRTTYARLFAAISTTWGSGDGSTTFNLPDQTDRYAIGRGTDSIGANVGNPDSELDLTHDHGPGTYEVITSDHTHDATLTVAVGVPDATTEVQLGVGVFVASNGHGHTGTATGTTDPNGGETVAVTGDSEEKNANPDTADGVDVDIRPDSNVYMWIIKT